MKTNDNIIISKTWQDTDFFEATIEANSDIIVAKTKVYVSRISIDKLCAQIHLFLYDPNVSRVRWESGPGGSQTTACISLDFLKKDRLGHVLIEISMEMDNSYGSNKYTCFFGVRAETQQLIDFCVQLSNLMNTNDVGYKAELASC